MPLIYTSKDRFSIFNSRNIHLFLGVFLILATFFYDNYYKKRVLSFSGSFAEQGEKVDEIKEKPKSLPIKIKIESLGIDLEVEEGAIKDGVWQISENNVSHLNISKVPGEGGNIVIYGHNKKNLFGPIRWIKVGDEIKVLNQEGKEFSYRVKEALTLTPDAIEYVYPKEEEILTLYTCTGAFDSKRFIVIAKPVNLITP